MGAAQGDSASKRAALLLIGVLGLVFSVLPACAAQKPSPKPTNEDCLACHSDATMSKDVHGKPVSLYVNPDAFKHSIHGTMFTCVDCHTDVKSSPHETTPAKISCAQCHADQQGAYDRSYHAKAIKAGDGQAATCADCHGSPHELLPASDPTSRVNHANIPATCGSCHGQKFVMGASGHSSQPFLSYQESVHGKAVAAGSDKAAVCTDCHGSHEILAANDAKSPIFKFNVPATCGKCHNNVAQEFTQSIHGQAIVAATGLAPVCTDCHGIHSIKAHLDPISSVSAANFARVTCARCHEGVRLSQEFGVKKIGLHVPGQLSRARFATRVADCGELRQLPRRTQHSAVHRPALHRLQANLANTCGLCHPGVNESSR